jgi:hypothetical protein
MIGAASKPFGFFADQVMVTEPETLLRLLLSLRVPRLAVS